MSMHRTLLLASALFTLHAAAMEVYVQSVIHSHCGAPTGVLTAQVSGGVPPYTYQWSTGGTTETIEDLPPGTYSVTVMDANAQVATAEGEVVDEWLMQGGQVGNYLVHCPGGYPMVDLDLYERTDQGYYLYGTPPFMITGPASIVSATTIPCPNIQNIDSVVRVEMNVPLGVGQTITWQDASGCPGQSTVVMSTEVVWPQVLVYDVQGSCSGGDNGQFSFAIPNAMQELSLFIYRPDGTPLQAYNLQWGVSTTRTQLAPGDYKLVVYCGTVGPFDDAQCADTTIVTIPDLGDVCGNASGVVYVDDDANCLYNTFEGEVPQAIVEFTPGPYYANSNGTGNYSANLPLGTYALNVVHPGVQQTCPGSVSLTSGQGIAVQDIGCSSLFPLDVQLMGSSGPARPGFETEQALAVSKNTLGSTGSSTLTYTYDPLLTFLAATPAPSSVVGNTLTWNIGWVGSSQIGFHLRFMVPSDVALIGTTLTGVASIATTNTDADLTNNTWNFAQLVTGSYDPNEKLARTSTGGDTTYLIDADEWIDYTIHFQNTGTDTAFMVVVTDTLPATLDPASIQVGAASHPYNWTLRDAGTLTFNFPGILLPDSNVNEPASHGFVSFRIKAREPLVPGTTIQNTANIFFDHNPPVITEPSVLTAEFSTGVHEADAVEVHLMPNPTDGLLYVQMPEGSTTTFDLLSMDGRRLVVPTVWRSGGLQIDVRSLAPGMYMLRTAAGTARFMKQ